MRNALLAGSLFLLTVGFAQAQPAAPATVPLPPNAAPPLPATAALPTDGVGAVPCLNQTIDTGGPSFWATGDYLLLWYTPMRTVPLIQGVPSAMATTGTPAATVALFPENNRISFDALSGFQGRVGVQWQKWGAEVGGFVMEDRTESARFFSNGTPLAIAQGYVPAGTGVLTSLYASLPGQYSGGVTASARSRLYGADANLRREWYTLTGDGSQLLFGFRYLDLKESLLIDAPSFFPDGAVIDVQDSIRTTNRYYGGYVGYHTRIGGSERGLGIDFTTKLGVGGVDQRVELTGFNTLVPVGGVTDLQAGGLYARGLNFGSFSRTKFAYSQDVDLRLTYNFNRWVQVSIGYSLIYLTSAVRPGKQIDPVVNDSNIRFVAQPTPSNLARPAFTWRAEEFVAQGMTFGLRIQY